jgi:hypothetical protein
VRPSGGAVAFFVSESPLTLERLLGRYVVLFTERSATPSSRNRGHLPGGLWPHHQRVDNGVSRDQVTSSDDLKLKIYPLPSTAASADDASHSSGINRKPPHQKKTILKKR